MDDSTVGGRCKARGAAPATQLRGASADLDCTRCHGG